MDEDVDKEQALQDAAKKAIDDGIGKNQTWRKYDCGCTQLLQLLNNGQSAIVEEKQCVGHGLIRAAWALKEAGDRLVEERMPPEDKGGDDGDGAKKADKG